MDIKMHRIGGGWHVSSVGMLKVPGSNDVIDTQLEFIVQDDDKAKLSDDESESNSSDDVAPSPKVKEPTTNNKKAINPDIVISDDANYPATTNFQNIVKKERKISRIIKNMRKTSTVKEMADFIIYPDGALSYYWMSLVTLAVMYNLAVVILRLAFVEVRDQKMFFLLDNISDVIYVVDIMVQTRTAFLEDGCLVLEPRAMFQNYRKKIRYWFDIIAIFPLASIYWISRVLMNVVTLNFSTALSVAPLPGLRFLRILKYHQVTTFFEIADSRTRRPSLLRAFKLSLHLWMVIHWIACIYYMLSEFEGRGTNEWVYSNSEDGGFRRKYIRSVYWSMMTLTTIGERPSPETDLEYIFTGLTFLIGVFVFAAVVGNVGDVISNMNAARHDFQSRMDQIKFYMNHRLVPEDLQDRVKKWAEYSWTRTQAMDEPSVLAMLPDRLRTEIAIHVHLDTLKQVKIFEECEEGLLRELVLKLRPIIYSPGDYICRTGEIGREMYIINHGKVEILVQKGEATTRVAMLKPGNYFGEISLLKLDEGQNRRTADVRAIGYSELLCLSRKDLISALGEYPDAKKILEAQAMKRMQETKGVRQTDKSPTTTGYSTKTNHETSGKRKASDVFSQVMKQEGFRKLLSSRDNEMHELKKMVAEMREISRKHKSPDAELLDEKCKAMEQKLANKDLALKQAKRRINQLETYVRIRAYNAKFQRYSVPESDPKEHITHAKSTDRKPTTLLNNVTTRTRKLSGNLEMYNDYTTPQDSLRSDKRGQSLKRADTVPEHKQNGYHDIQNGHPANKDEKHSIRNHLSHQRQNNDTHSVNKHATINGQINGNDSHRNGPKPTENKKTFCTTSNFRVEFPPTHTQLPNPSNRELQRQNTFSFSSTDTHDHQTIRTTDFKKNPTLKSWHSADSLLPANSISTRLFSTNQIQNGDDKDHSNVGTVQKHTQVPETNYQENNKVNDIVMSSGTHISTATFMVSPPKVKQAKSGEESLETRARHHSNKTLRSFISDIKLSRVPTQKSEPVSEIQNHESFGKSSPHGSPRPPLKYCKRNSEETIDSGISDKEYLTEDELVRLMELITKDQSLDSVNTSISENDSELDSDEDLD